MTHPNPDLENVVYPSKSKICKSKICQFLRSITQTWYSKNTILRMDFDWFSQILVVPRLDHGPLNRILKRAHLFDKSLLGIIHGWKMSITSVWYIVSHLCDSITQKWYYHVCVSWPQLIYKIQNFPSFQDPFIFA